MTTRTEVVQAARRYMGAAWQHQARRDNAVDCVGLIVRVARDIGIVDVPPADYALTPDGAELVRTAERYMTRLPLRGFTVGDVLVMRFQTHPQHFGIVGDYFAGGFSLIHAHRGSKEVIEHRLDDTWRRRIVAAFALPGVC